jgi:hypothetical protein
MRTCAYCGRDNQEDATHCQECGTELAISPPPSPPRIGVYHALFIIAGCVMVVMILSFCFPPSPTAKRELLTLGFVGFTNYSGQKAAAFTLTNGSGRTLYLTASAETQGGSTRPVYLDPAWSERNLSAGAPLAARGSYPSASQYQLKAGQRLTFFTAVPNERSSWRVQVNYFQTLTPWQAKRLSWAQFFWNRGKIAWLGDLIWKKGYLPIGVVYGPDLRD